MNRIASLLLLAAAFALFGCTQPPSCDKATPGVQTLAENRLAKALQPLGLALADVATLKIMDVMPVSYDRDTRKRTCAAKLHVDFKPGTFANIDQLAWRFAHPAHAQVRQDIQQVQLTAPLLRQQGFLEDDQITVDYEFDVGLYEDREGSYIGSQPMRLAVVTPFVRAGAQANAFAQQAIAEHQKDKTTPRDLPLRVSKAEPCGEEAICVYTNESTVRLNAAALSEDQMKSLVNAALNGYTMCFRDVVASDSPGEVTAEGFTTGSSCASR